MAKRAGITSNSWKHASLTLLWLPAASPASTMPGPLHGEKQQQNKRLLIVVTLLNFEKSKAHNTYESGTTGGQAVAVSNSSTTATAAAGAATAVSGLTTTSKTVPDVL